MKALRKRAAFVAVCATLIVSASVGVAFAAPVIKVGQGVPNAVHSGYPGLCTNCHGFAVWPAPAIDAGVTATHANRGSTCTPCHTVNTTPPPAAVSRDVVKGASRYETGIKVSQAAYPGGAPAVVLATGVNFLTRSVPRRLRQRTAGRSCSCSRTEHSIQGPAEINRCILGHLIIGSSGVVSAGIEQQSRRSLGVTVARLAGADRFATAGVVADAVKARLGSVDTIVVANGMTYADALAVAPLAAAKGWPILLTRTASLPSPTASAVTRMGASSSLIVGGAVVVGPGVQSALPSPVRKGGANRYETCALVADYAASLGMTYEYFGTTVGTNFPDALAAGPLFAQKNGIMLLTAPTSVAAPVSSRISANKAAVASFVVIGGAVKQATVDTMSSLMN